MFKQKRITLNQAIVISMFILGLVLVIISMFYVSSFLAILGVAFFFGGAILLYIAPTKQVPIAMLYAEAEVSASNIERIINESGMSLPGIYLPPRNLKNADSSIVIIPKKPKITLPFPDEINDSLTTNRKDGVLIVPLGSALCRLFEKELGFSFTKTNLVQVQYNLPKLLVEGLELAEEVEIQIQGNTVTVEITGSVLDEICRQTDFQPKTHKQVGCLLSSAIACTLAKATGKPVTIQNETRNQETKTTKIEYQILEGYIMQLPPLAFSDLCLLLAVDAIILLIIAELSSPKYGLTNLTINKKKLRNAALTIGLLFLVTVAIRIISIITGS